MIADQSKDTKKVARNCESKKVNESKEIATEFPFDESKFIFSEKQEAKKKEFIHHRSCSAAF